MPEGHTLHRLAARIERDLVDGAPVRASSPQGRALDVAAAVGGRALSGAEAVGKHLLLRFEGLGGEVVHIHLGLYGRVRWRRTPADGGEPEVRGQVRLRLLGSRWTMDLSGPTACELLAPPQVDALLARLGPDPLRPRARPDRFLRAVQRRRVPIGQLLLDQSAIAGVGNVYRAEALWAAGLHPLTPANALTRDEALGLWRIVRAQLRDGVRDGHIITARPRRGVPRSKLRRRERVNVYRRSTCGPCGAPVERLELAARTIYLCPACQPPRESRP